jgi:hypothetical protein
MRSANWGEEVFTGQTKHLSGTKRDEIYEFIYGECYPAIKKYIVHHGGNEQDCKDILHDTYMIISSKENLSGLFSKKSPAAYYITIGINLWIKEAMRRQTYTRCIIEEQMDTNQAGDMDLYMVAHQKYDLYWKHFIRMGHECKKILRAFFNRENTRQISEKLGLSQDNYYKKKSVCIKYLESKIKKDPKYTMISNN